MIDTKGMTALHAAAGAGHLDIVDLLIQHGAWVNPLDGQQKTPLDWAIAGGHPAITAPNTAKGMANTLCAILTSPNIRAIGWEVDSAVVIDKGRMVGNLSRRREVEYTPRLRPIVQPLDPLH